MRGEKLPDVSIEQLFSSAFSHTFNFYLGYLVTDDAHDRS